MTEKEIYDLQNDVYWWLETRMKDIPPMLQKMIIEGIYSRYQTKATAYDWNLNIIDRQHKEEKDQKEAGTKINEQN